jgi:quercetin dioxygenase-like cupin family protein
MRASVVVVLAMSVLGESAARPQDKAGHPGGGGHQAVRPDALKWGPGPPGLPPRAELAVLVGDPGKAGSAYVVRARLPDGYRIPPHWHPSDENVTVLQGVLLMGTGETFDPARAEALPAGSFVRMPAGTRHAAAAKGETVIQLHGVGPFEVTYVNPADDPRKKPGKR